MYTLSPYRIQNFFSTISTKILVNFYYFRDLVGKNANQTTSRSCFLYISDKKGTFHFHFSDKIHIKRNFLKKGTKWQSLVNSPVLCTLVAYIGHWAYVIPHLIIKQTNIGLRILKNSTTKTAKNEKMPQNSQFWACFGVFEQLNLVRLNFAVAVMLYFAHVLQMKMVTKLKSREIA